MNKLLKITFDVLKQILAFELNDETISQLKFIIKNGRHYLLEELQQHLSQEQIQKLLETERPGGNFKEQNDDALIVQHFKILNNFLIGLNAIEPEVLLLLLKNNQFTSLKSLTDFIKGASSWMSVPILFTGISLSAGLWYLNHQKELNKLSENLREIDSLYHSRYEPHFSKIILDIDKELKESFGIDLSHSTSLRNTIQEITKTIQNIEEKESSLNPPISQEEFKTISELADLEDKIKSEILELSKIEDEIYSQKKELQQYQLRLDKKEEKEDYSREQLTEKYESTQKEHTASKESFHNKSISLYYNIADFLFKFVQISRIFGKFFELKSFQDFFKKTLKRLDREYGLKNGSIEELWIRLLSKADQTGLTEPPKKSAVLIDEKDSKTEVLETSELSRAKSKLIKFSQKYLPPSQLPNIGEHFSREAEVQEPDLPLTQAIKSALSFLSELEKYKESSSDEFEKYYKTPSGPSLLLQEIQESVDSSEQCNIFFKNGEFEIEEYILKLLDEKMKISEKVLSEDPVLKTLLPGSKIPNQESLKEIRNRLIQLTAQQEYFCLLNGINFSSMIEISPLKKYQERYQEIASTLRMEPTIWNDSDLKREREKLLTEKNKHNKNKSLQEEKIEAEIRNKIQSQKSKFFRGNIWNKTDLLLIRETLKTIFSDYPFIDLKKLIESIESALKNQSGIEGIRKKTREKKSLIFQIKSEKRALERTIELEKKINQFEPLNEPDWDYILDILSQENFKLLEKEMLNTDDETEREKSLAYFKKTLEKLIPEGLDSSDKYVRWKFFKGIFKNKLHPNSLDEKEEDAFFAITGNFPGNFRREFRDSKLTRQQYIDKEVKHFELENKNSSPRKKQRRREVLSFCVQNQKKSFEFLLKKRPKFMGHYTLIEDLKKTNGSNLSIHTVDDKLTLEGALLQTLQQEEKTVSDEIFRSSDKEVTFSLTAEGLETINKALTAQSDSRKRELKFLEEQAAKAQSEEKGVSDRIFTTSNKEVTFSLTGEELEPSDKSLEKSVPITKEKPKAKKIAAIFQQVKENEEKMRTERNVSPREIEQKTPNEVPNWAPTVNCLLRDPNWSWETTDSEPLKLIQALDEKAGTLKENFRTSLANFQKTYCALSDPEKVELEPLILEFEKILVTVVSNHPHSPDYNTAQLEQIIRAGENTYNERQTECINQVVICIGTVVSAAIITTVTVGLLPASGLLLIGLTLTALAKRVVQSSHEPLVTLYNSARTLQSQIEPLKNDANSAKVIMPAT